MRGANQGDLFSLEPARGEGSNIKSQLASVKTIRKVLIMSRKWAETNCATQSVDRRKGVENAASFRSNGTGPFRVRERQPSQKTVLQRSPIWWNKFETNLDEVVFLPIKNSAIRVAALLSGEIDIVDPVPLQDILRVNSSPTLWPTTPHCSSEVGATPAG